MKRKSRYVGPRYDTDYESRNDYMPPDSGDGKKKGSRSSWVNATTLAVLAGVFILGIGIGMGFSSVSNSSSSGKIVTLSDLETRAPNAELCVQFGSSAIVMDTRVFVTLNPLNVFVSQPSTQPGCVLRSNNWSVLEQRGLLKGDQVRSCRQRMNTFGFTGTLESSPQIDCVYQNDAAKNLFLDQSGVGTAGAAPENQRF
ncbi:MAG: DUF3172 domain-containing protein [Leptolyngbyaceae cyanobacterium]